MQYTTLGRTGITVSRVCFGTMSFGKEADEAASAALFGRCLEAGVNFFDTANIYSGGRAEEILGKLIRGKRDRLVITSKVGFGMGRSAAAAGGAWAAGGGAGDGPNERGLSRRHILMQIEASLRRLGTEWLDVYFCHTEDPFTPVEETLRVLEDLVRAGKVRHAGVSNWPAWKIGRAAGWCAARGGTGFEVMQPMYSLAKRMAEVELLPLAQAEGLGVIPYSPLGGGLLTGKYNRPEGAPEGRLRVNKMYATRYGDEGYYQVAARFAAYAEQAGVSAVTLAVAWVKAHPAVTAPIIGARNVGQLEPALAAGDYTMSAAQWQEMAALTPAVPVATDRDEERGKSAG